MELGGELGTCSLAIKLGLWLAIRLCRYGFTPMKSGVFPPTLCLVGGVVVEVPTKVCCGGVYGALELSIALVLYSLRLRLDSRLYSGLCTIDCIMKRCVHFEHSLCMFCIIGGGCFRWY